MKRYTEFDLRGKHFVLALTIGAQIELEETFGGFNLSEVFYCEDLKTVYKNTVDVFTKLSEEGAHYCKMFEEKEVDVLPKEELYRFFTLGDINPVREAIVAACIAGWKRDVELEESDAKNLQTPGE